MWWQLQLADVRLQPAGDFNAVNYSRPLMAASSPEVCPMMIMIRMMGRGQADWLEDTAQCSLSWSARLQLLASTAEGLEFGWWSSEPWADSREQRADRAASSGEQDSHVTWHCHAIGGMWRGTGCRLCCLGPASQLGPDCYVMTLARGNTGHGDTGSLLNFMVELKPSKN